MQHAGSRQGAAAGEHDWLARVLAWFSSSSPGILQDAYFNQQMYLDAGRLDDQVSGLVAAVEGGDSRAREQLLQLLR